MLDEEMPDHPLGAPAPGYPDEQRTVINCIAVVMDEEIEHYRFAARDLAVLEASQPRPSGGLPAERKLEEAVPR